MLEPTESSDLTSMITNMCTGNEKMSRKLAKVFIKAINQNNVEKIVVYLKALKKYLIIDDDFKKHRLEWVFGVGQIVWKKNYGGGFQYGVERIERINDEAYTYNSSLVSNAMDDAMFTKLLSCKGRMDTFCVRALKDLLSLCSKCDTIARFVYNSPPPSL